MPVLQPLAEPAAIAAYYGVKKYPEDREIISLDSVQKHIQVNQVHISELLKDLKQLFLKTPHEVLGTMKEMFRYLEHYRLYEFGSHGNKPFYQDRNLRNIYRTRDEMRYHQQEFWESSRRFKALEGIPLNDARACIQAEPTADRFIGYLRTAVSRLSRHVALLIKESSDNYFAHYQYNAFTDVWSGLQDDQANKLLNPIFSEQYFGLLPDGANKDVYTQAVSLVRRYGAVRQHIETNSIDDLLVYSNTVVELIKRLDYAQLRDQYNEVMALKNKPTRATYNFYDYQNRHREHYDGRVIEPPHAPEALRTFVGSKVGLNPVDNAPDAAFFLVIGRETNTLLVRLMETMERIRSFSMLQTTYERHRHQQSHLEEAVSGEEDS